jgi:hypothetical protein
VILRIALLAVSCLLGGCEVSIGPDKDGEGNRSAEAGKVSLEAPGIDVKFDIPSIEKVAKVEAASESDLLYPGSQLGALHVNARDEDSKVDLRFTSEDSLDVVAGWYRDPGRSDHFAIESSARDGAAYVMEGRDKDGDGSFRLRLEPNPGGGTAGRLLLTDG